MNYQVRVLVETISPLGWVRRFDFLAPNEVGLTQFLLLDRDEVMYGLPENMDRSGTDYCEAMDCRWVMGDDFLDWVKGYYLLNLYRMIFYRDNIEGSIDLIADFVRMMDRVLLESRVIIFTNGEM